jgi:hypothetical protein
MVAQRLILPAPAAFSSGLHQPSFLAEIEHVRAIPGVVSVVLLWSNVLPRRHDGHDMKPTQIDPPNRSRNWMKSLAATAPSPSKSKAAR